MTLATESLKKVSLMNFAANSIDFGAKLVVTFILHPFIIQALGSTYFGIWQVLGQLNGYLGTADIQSGNTLRFILSKERSNKEKDTLKRYISAALFSNVFFMPVYFIVGLFIVWFAPIITNVDESNYLLVRSVASILVISFIITQFFYLFEATLAGMNLAYKRIGIRSAVILTGGVLSVLVLYLGGGLIGLAIVSLITSLITGITFVYVVKKNIPWFGFVKVKLVEIKKFVNQSLWFVAMKFVALLQNSSDIIILGYFTNPETVTTYTVTKFATFSILAFLKTSFGAVSIGYGKFIGQGDFSKIVSIKDSFVTIQWALATVFGSVMIIFTQSFVGLWTEPNLYAGNLEMLLIIISAVLTILVQFQSNVINISLQIRQKVLGITLSVLISYIIMAFLIPSLKVLGLLIGLTIGNLVTLVYTEFLFGKIVKHPSSILNYIKDRRMLVGVMLLTLSYQFSANLIMIDNWIMFFCFAISVSLLIILIVYLLLLKDFEKKFVNSSAKKIYYKFIK